ncbi:MAG: DUF1573 domain-containing protein [Chitinispirillaceae bacterium]|nr:DUF1573 domain-containing protein [Chitinispirillaceae bacterium]
MHITPIRFFPIINCLMLMVFQLSAAPMIKVDSANFDMGIIKEGAQKSIKHTFIVKNTGDETLIIEKVKPG